VEAVTIAQLGAGFRPIAGTEKTFRVDTLLVAVGLNPVDEFARKAKSFGMNVWMAGDAEEIAEASAAMFCGRIRGIEVARSLGVDLPLDRSQLEEKANVLKSPAGKQYSYEVPSRADGVFPVLHCVEEIPCNPCMTVCPKKAIRSSGHPILGVPVLDGTCDGCMRCVAICPGLAISLVDYRKQPEGKVQVTIAYELGSWRINVGDDVTLMDWEGGEIGTGQVRVVRDIKANNRTVLLKIEVDEAIGKRVAGIRAQSAECVKAEEFPLDVPIADDAYVCRCERVKASEIRAAIRSGVRDLNHLKGHCRSGMGACGGKTCSPIVERICREEGVAPSELTPFTLRPVFAETQLGYFVRR
jgi:ferredoxin